MGDFKTFNDLVFTDCHDKLGVFQAVLHFDNDYGVSVINDINSLTYRVSIFMENAEGVRKSLGVRHYRSPDSITMLMQRLQDI